ncbi:MAG: 30S ribosome-binding factor RbfA [Clostridia bacterium]|nr:30S ribosome-binding factor RbfA [Clostridia bacterium]
MASYRSGRIDEEVKRELGAVIRELKDPRISGVVSVVAVKVTKDLSFAKAYISVLGTPKQQSDTMLGINSAAGFIRKEIGQRLNLRHTPQFLFKADNSIEHGAHINKLITDVLSQDENRGGAENAEQDL